MVHFKSTIALSMYRGTLKVPWYITPWYFKIYHGMQHGANVPRYKGTNVAAQNNNCTVVRFTVHSTVHFLMGLY